MPKKVKSRTNHRRFLVIVPRDIEDLPVRLFDDLKTAREFVNDSASVKKAVDGYCDMLGIEPSEQSGHAFIVEFFGQIPVEVW